MFPNPWVTSVPPPIIAKPIGNSYENNTQQQQQQQPQQQAYPFYAAPNPLQNMAVTQQNILSLNTASVMTPQSLQPNAIDPAMVHKWQEWRRWELWNQHLHQWQQQGHIAAPSTQPVPPSMSLSQPLQPSQLSTIPFQNQHYQYNQPIPPLPLTNQPQQAIPNNDVAMKRGLEPELQNNEKKLKIDSANNKKEFPFNKEESELKFEEQFRTWEEQFLKWKEQNKNHPDKNQYIEYEKKWLNWRDHLKHKCDILKRKKELKMAEKKKEAMQVEGNKLQSQQISGYNIMMSNITNKNEPSVLQHSLNTSTMPPPVTENQIPGLDLVSNNENIAQGFPNMLRILPQNQNGPIQTPDDKPFNFPKTIPNPAAINQHPVSTTLSNINPPSTSMYQNSTGWSKYNNPVLYYNQKPPSVDNTSIPIFVQQTNNNSQVPYSGNTCSTSYNISQNSTSVNFRRPMEASYINNSSNETNKFYNQATDNQSYNKNFNTLSNNFHGYNQLNANTSNFNKPTIEQSNIPYHQPKQSLNPTASKPPSLLSLNLVKPILLDKPGNYSENKNVIPNRYERNWNIDEEEDPENEYMEAHKKFSSEPSDDQTEDQFSNNNQHKNMFNENNHYSRGEQGTRKFNDDYLKPLNQLRGSQNMKNTNNDYQRSNNQFSRNVGQNYPREIQTLKNNNDDYYKPQTNLRNIDQGFNKGASFVKDADNNYFNEHDVNKTNFIPQKGNYGPSSRGNFGNNINRKNKDWDKNYTKNEGSSLQPIKDTIVPPLNCKPYEAPPIDPVKIFDYRHLSSLKVIPGLSKETVIPIRIYDYKHGGKRILPWQDRGFSRRNANQTRDLNEKEGFIQNNTIDSDKYSRKPLIEKPKDEKDQNTVKNKIDEIEEIGIKSTTVDTITIDNGKKVENLQPDIETSDMCAPSPPKMSTIREEKSPERQLLTIETLLCPPGRPNRPSKIVIILRGLPGSGKSHIARLIKEKEVEMGGQAPRILSLDDYFMTEVTKTEIDPETNKKVEKKVMEYEYDSANESLYRTSFIKAFKKKILENYFSFYIIDAINNKVSYYKDILEISKINGFTVYIVELESDVDLCIKRNIHNRTAHDINGILRSWVKTPSDQILLDIRSLLHSESKSEVEMEDVSDIEMELDKDEETIVDDNNSEDNKSVEFEEEDVMKLLSCKWTDTIPQEEKMKRLDGLCKKKTERSIKEWLQIPEDDYTVSEQVIVKDGKKRVRWADMEERREQEKLRAIGFVVGQTDWDRMLGRDQEMKKLNNGLNLITLKPTQKKIIEQYLGPDAFTTHRWANKIVLTDLKDAYVSSSDNDMTSL